MHLLVLRIMGIVPKEVRHTTEIKAHVTKGVSEEVDPPNHVEHCKSLDQLAIKAGATAAGIGQIVDNLSKIT